MMPISITMMVRTAATSAADLSMVPFTAVILPIAIALPAVIGMIVLILAGLSAWRAEQRKRKAEHEEQHRLALLASLTVPDDASGVFIANRATQRLLSRSLRGMYFVAGVGTYGWRS